MEQDNAVYRARLQGRYPIMRCFKYEHLPEKLQEISKPFAEMAVSMAARRMDGCSETAAGLRKLLEAKDCAVRAMVED